MLLYGSRTCRWRFHPHGGESAQPATPLGEEVGPVWWWDLLQRLRPIRPTQAGHAAYGSQTGAYLNAEAAREMWPDTQPPAGPDPEEGGRR